MKNQRPTQKQNTAHEKQAMTAAAPPIVAANAPAPWKAIGRSPGRPGDAPRVGVYLAVPPSWYEFDIHPATRDQAIRRLVTARAKENEAVADQREAVVRSLKKLARDAWAGGAVYCACMAENLATTPLVASVSISILRAGTGGGPLSTAPADIARALGGKRARSAHDTWRTATLVDLPHAGSAARVHGIDDVSFPGDARTLRMVQTQTFVPVPDSDYVAVIAGASPVLDLAAAFHDLFDAVTSTFRFVPPDPPPPNQPPDSPGTARA